VFDAITTWAQQAMAAGGSIGLAFVMLIENLFPPIPSELVLPYAGFQVGQGNLPMFQALLASTGGSVLGALLLYLLGRYGGRPLVLRFRRVLRVSERDLDRADAWFDRYGPGIVLVARIVPIARSIVSIPAGWSEMPIWKFLALTTIGTATWNTLLIGGGALLGERYEQVAAMAGAASRVALVLLVAAMVAVGVWWARRRRAA
jgi:membrane protein DedA with SNARE-associated domain